MNEMYGKHSFQNLLTTKRRFVMKKTIMYLVCGILGVLFLMPSSATATELVFTFVNPAFGGNPFNAQWLMDSAQAQNKLEESRGMFERDPIEDFKNTLNRQILYRLSRKVIDAAFGEEGLEPGHYNLGDYTIDVSITLTGIRIVLTDVATGNQTIIEVPYY